MRYIDHTFRMEGGVITDRLGGEGSDRLDFLMIGEEGLPYWLENSGTKNYHAHSIRARASGDSGDNRINSFGIGGEMEIRAGLLYQRSEEHTSELQSRGHLVCRLLLEKK